MFKRRPTIKTSQAAPCFDKRLLGQVLQFLAVAFVPVEYCEDMRLVALNKHGKVIGRTFADSIEQFGIIVDHA